MVVKKQIDQFSLLNVVPTSNPLGIKRFDPSIFISFKCECYIIMQMQYTKNLNPERLELGTTMSEPHWSNEYRSCFFGAIYFGS